MKRLLLTLSVMLMTVTGMNAMSYETAREHALYLTDKMAYELDLNEEQYEYAYEINLDYLMGLNTMDDIDGAYLRYRNADFQHILYDWQWRRFLATSYFFRPILWRSGAWYYPIYSHYRHDHWYYGRPNFFYSYRGGHGRDHFHNSYYYERRPTYSHGMRVGDRGHAYNGRGNSNHGYGNRGNFGGRENNTGDRSNFGGRDNSGGRENNAGNRGSDGRQDNNGGIRGGAITDHGRTTMDRNTTPSRSYRNITPPSNSSFRGSSISGSTYRNTTSSSGSYRGNSMSGSSRSMSGASHSMSGSSRSMGGSSRGGSFGGSRGSSSQGGHGSRR